MKQLVNETKYLYAASEWNRHWNHSRRGLWAVIHFHPVGQTEQQFIRVFRSFILYFLQNDCMLRWADVTTRVNMFAFQRYRCISRYGIQPPTYLIICSIFSLEIFKQHAFIQTNIYLLISGYDDKQIKIIKIQMQIFKLFTAQ